MHTNTLPWERCFRTAPCCLKSVKWSKVPKIQNKNTVRVTKAKLNLLIKFWYALPYEVLACMKLVWSKVETVQVPYIVQNQRSYDLIDVSTFNMFQRPLCLVIVAMGVLISFYLAVFPFLFKKKCVEDAFYGDVRSRRSQIT